MKRYLIILSCCAAVMAGCKQEELVFDHELQQFETLDNAILIELIAPTGTAIDDEIYIFGAFNGEDETSAVGKIAWQLEKASKSDKKWCIYLFPKDFVDGKSLADGFSFVNKKSGGERDINGKPVVHTLNTTTGTRHNIWADRWASYFSSDETTVKHNGPVVYVLDESDISELTLYMYGDVNDLNGGWPGMNITGYETVSGIDLAYFDLGEGNEGLSETLIFSDNGSDQLADFGPITLGSEPVYLRITSEGKVETLSLDGVVEHDGAVVYILDGMEWGLNTTLYMWGDLNDLNGGWPGMSVNGTETFGEYTYMYYDLGAANEGLTEHLIFSNGGQSQLPDYDDYTIGEDIYLYLSKDGPHLITDPANPGDVVWYNPTATPKETAVIDIFMYNATETLGAIYLYSWGSGEVFGAWPGTALESMETTSILGLELNYTKVECNVGDIFHLIVNNNNGTQLEDYTIEASEAENAYYLKIDDNSINELTVAPKKHMNL